MINATIKKLASFSMMIMLTIFVTSSSSFAQYTWSGPELIEAGDFAGDSLSASWTVEGGANGVATVVNGELAITDIAAVANQYDFQFNQGLSAEDIAELAKGGTIEVTFDARTEVDSTKTFHVFLGQVGGSWARYWQSPGDGDVTVDGTMKTYTLTTDVKETWEAMRLGFEVSGDTKDVYFDNISVRRVSENVVFNGGFDATPADSMWTTEGSNGVVNYVDGELAITDVTAGNPWDIQVFQAFNAEQLDSIYIGPYEISFDARTDAAEKTFNVFFGNNGTDGDWTSFGGPVTVSDQMSNYTLPVTVGATWANMKFGFEVGAEASSVFFDNVILKRVREVAPAEPTFSLSTTDGIVTITVVAVDGAANYDVYFSDAAIDTLDNASLVGTVVDSTGLSITHTTKAPHPTLVSDFDAHYAVVAKSAKGTESPFTSSSINTPMSVAENYAAEITTEAIDAVFAAVDDEVIPEASALAGFFPSNYVPFTINEETKIVVSGAGGDSDADISSKHWIGFYPAENYMVIYAEMNDDILAFASEAIGAGGAWNYDSWEMGIGNYTPESFIAGSDHADLLGGDEADWQLRGGILTDGDAERGFIQAYGKADRINGELPNSVTLAERTETGYRTLTLMDMGQLAGGPTNDAAFTFPTGENIALFPLNISLNDNDATARDTQINWADKTVDGGWWQDPRQWDIVAFVGSDAFPVSNEEDGSSDQPLTFSLDQNYPNPFNPTTNISFTLANSSNVTLEVFNMLGQKVATLLQGEKMTTGQHTQAFDASSLASGMYLYRLSTSNFVQSRKMMLIK